MITYKKVLKRYCPTREVIMLKSKCHVIKTDVLQKNACKKVVKLKNAKCAGKLIYMIEKLKKRL